MTFVARQLRLSGVGPVQGRENVLGETCKSLSGNTICETCPSETLAWLLRIRSAEERFRLFTLAPIVEHQVMNRYSPPVLSHFGSIVDCTFATPAQGGDPKQPGGGPFSCGLTAGRFDSGGKSQQVLLCDKFGEYSHPDTTVTNQSVS